MSVLFGLIQPDAGQIEWKGAVQSFRTARDAIARGLGMVHQHFMLYPSLSVLENIIIGAETCDVSGRVSYARSRADIEAITHKFGIALDLDAKVLTAGAGPSADRNCEAALPWRRSDYP